MWFFWSDEGETPLTKAIINQDLDTIKSLCHFKDHVFARNHLGFNAIDLVHYLDYQEAIEMLSPELPSGHKVILPNETKVRELTTEEFEKHFGLKLIRHLKFPDYPLFKKVVQNMSWYFDAVEPKDLMTALYELHREKISSGAFCDAVIRWIDDVLQYGVFADQDLNPGDYVGEYVGFVQKIYPLRYTFNEYCFRYPQIAFFRSFFIDSKYKGNYSRFLNHSFEPNLDIKPAAENGLIHTLFFANQAIKRGTQLTFNYGEEYWAHRLPPVEILQ